MERNPLSLFESDELFAKCRDNTGKRGPSSLKGEANGFSHITRKGNPILWSKWPWIYLQNIITLIVNFGRCQDNWRYLGVARHSVFSIPWNDSEQLPGQSDLDMVLLLKLLLASVREYNTGRIHVWESGAVILIDGVFTRSALQAPFGLALLVNWVDFYGNISLGQWLTMGIHPL